MLTSEYWCIFLMKNNNKHLTFLESSIPTITFTKINFYPLIELFKHSAEAVLTQQFIKKNRKELYTYVLQFEVEDKHKKWRIIKKLKDFFDLRQNLHFSYRQKLLPIPISEQQEASQDIYPQLLQFFEVFLNNLVQQADIYEQLTFRTFLCNNLTHENNQLQVFYQGYLNKRNWGRHNEWGFKKIFQFLASWEKRYFTITKDGVFFCENEHNLQILDNLIISTTFSFHCGQASAGYQYGILINSSHRVLQLDAEDIFTFALFVYNLSKAINENKNITKNRYGSFARIRSACQGQFFIDGQDYFSSMCDSLLLAKKQVFIAGWMISPYFSLKRPDDKEQYRFDVVLGKIARAGIKVNILIYNAPMLALNNDPQFSQKYLTGISSNIRVLLHPNYLLIPFMWSHHEKMVIIDQKIAYMGGLDIGYGRFDSKQHYLADVSAQLWPGVDYCNLRVTDIYSPKQFRTSSINRKTIPRMPWHDIAVKLTGGSVQDLSRHFIQYWNHANFQLSMNDRQLLVYAGLSTIMSVQDKKPIQQVEKEQQAKNSLILSRRALSSSTEQNNEDLGESFDFLKLEGEQTINKNRSQKISVQTDYGSSSYSSSTFELQRSSIAANQQQLQFYKSHLQVNKIKQFLKKINPQNIINHRYGTNFQNVILDEQAQYHIKNSKNPSQTHQIVRSNSMWGIGLEDTQTEHSILNAYIELITNAKEYIYIQNQFFISVQNGVLKLLCKRIKQAHKKKERFRVMVVLPALPGFEGHPADENATIFRVQVHLALSNVRYMYRKLRHIDILDNYLYFFSLRTHAVLNQKPVTEIIYVHSKLMIVDDRIAIIGSANINDRSLLGNRDTQLCVVIEDEQPQQLKVRAETYIISKFAHELRKELYMEHFGITESESIDYFNDDVWYSIIEISKKNHNVYREIFGCYPDDQMTSFKKMREVESKADLKKYQLFSQLIKGQAIPYQKEFLKEEDLTIKPYQKQYIMPEISFN